MLPISAEPRKSIVFLRFLSISLKAYGLWHLALGHRLSAVGIELWGSRTELPGASLHPVMGCKGSLVEPLGAKWPPKAAKEEPKANTERPKVAKARPDATTRRPATKNHQKSSPKHAPEQRRTMKKQGFPLLFLCISLKAHGLWHLALGRRLLALSIKL